VAHPDDESFGLGAVLAAMVGEGAEVGVLCLTHGEASTLHGVDGDLRAVREGELAEAAGVLGARRTWLLDHPDGALSDVGMSVVVADVLSAASAMSAEAFMVFDPSGVTGHPDHATAAAAALRAADILDIPVVGWTLPAEVAQTLNAENGTSFTGHAAGDITYRVRVRREVSAARGRRARQPGVAGSGFVQPGGPPGFVFCARVADHPRVQFRWVEPGGPDGPASVEDTLACLAQARQAQGAERVLDDAVHARAYAAWDRARADIVMHWNDAADPANLAATVAPTVQRAVELVRRARPTDMPLDEADRLVDRLQTTYPPRILRQVRQVTGSAQSAPDQVRALARLADELGLQLRLAAGAAPGDRGRRRPPRLLARHHRPRTRLTALPDQGVRRP